MRLMKISEFSKRCGVSPETIRRWEGEGRIRPIRTCGGHRRYTDANLQQSMVIKASEREIPKTGRVVLYCRVSPHEQGQLDRQVSVLHMFSLWRGYHNVELISEVADGNDMQRPELLSLVHKIIAGNVDRLIVAHKDRLVPFGFELLEFIAGISGCEITVLDQISMP